MLTRVLQRVFGTNSERAVKRMTPLLERVLEIEAECVHMTNDELRTQTARFKRQLAEAEEAFHSANPYEDMEPEEYAKALRERLDEELDRIMPEAFAVVREACKRVVGMRPFDVQMVGAIVLHQGNIAEMVTGEGKTLVATMPAYLNALTGHGVHVVTVNDFLARRDSQWMGPVYEFLGLTVGLITHDMSYEERQVGYRADITYGTNNEFGFDYLRDNMAVRPEMRVQRELNYAIVDEVDSILIDEARTPLIISGRPEKSTDLYYKVDDVVRQMRKEKHFELEEKGHHVLLSEEGMEIAERLLGVDDLYTSDSLGLLHMVQQSIRAHHFYKRDDEYMVRNGEVLIVDEFTGRSMEGRRYADGLHQALEAKERVPVQFEFQTIASITYQNYFRLYNKLSGMTGTAATEAMEFAQIYSLEVIQIPTNLPLIRDDMTDLIFATERGKFNYVADEIRRVHETGRPVLVGTVSIEKSEALGQLLGERGVDTYEVLNAKYHEREAAIVATAGKMGAITIATNMAGRGTDIKLAEGVRELGGLAIFGTERHESRRIDNQLRGRCGRQGDPGTTRFYVSLEDEVARLFGGDRVKRLLNWLGSNEEMDEQPLDQKMVSKTIERAQRQVEEYNFEIRKHVLEYDEVMDKQRRVIYGLRREVLEDRDITERLHEMFENNINDIIAEYAPDDVTPDEWDLEGLDMRFRGLFGIAPDIVGDTEAAPRHLPDRLLEQVINEYERRERLIEEELRTGFREQVGGDDSHIDFPRLARRRVHDLEMMALLRAVDEKWIDHLYSMDYLRESVRLRAYGQRDPLVEYKTEGFEMFQTMLATIEQEVTQMLFRLTDPEVRRNRRVQARQGRAIQDDPFAQLSRYTYVAADKEQDRSFAAYDTSRFALAGQEDAASTAEVPTEKKKAKPQPIRVGPKTKPNDPCPCGSGKKYKKCCGKQM